MVFKIGDRVKVEEHNDNETYDSFRKKILIVTHVAKNREQHQGYDEGIGGNLYSFRDLEGKDIPVSLYDYELEKEPTIAQIQSKIKPVGWKQESARHSLASKGIKTGRKGKESEAVKDWDKMVKKIKTTPIYSQEEMRTMGLKPFTVSKLKKARKGEF